MDHFTTYYLEQAGEGGTEADVGEDSLGPVFKGGFVKGQRGRGFIRNAVRSLWNFFKPVVSTGAQTIGKEAINTGAKILADAAASSSSEDLKEATKRRLLEGRDSVVKKMRGGGRRRRRRTGVKKKVRRGRVSRKTRKTRRVRPVRRVRRVRRRRVRTKGDIFGTV